MKSEYFKDLDALSRHAKKRGPIPTKAWWKKYAHHSMRVIENEFPHRTDKLEILAVVIAMEWRVLKDDLLNEIVGPIKPTKKKDS